MIKSLQWTRGQWYELDDQFSCTPEHQGSEGMPGEHLRLIAPLNRSEV